MNVPAHTPIQEAIGMMLFGVENVPPGVARRMVSQTARMASEYVSNIEAERGRLREALEFYAERSNYHMIETEFEDIFESDVGVDSGKIACKALGYTWPHGHSSWRYHHDS